MFTNCPTCARQFRIRASQLATAEGLVQCGFCGKQFNALERLYDKPLVNDRELMATPSEEETAGPDFYIPEIEDDSMDGEGTIPWMESVESSLERRPRERLEHILEETEATEKLDVTRPEPVIDVIMEVSEPEPEIKPEPEFVPVPEPEFVPKSATEFVAKPESQLPPESPGPVIALSTSADYPFPDELAEVPTPQASTLSRLFWSFGALLLFLAGTAQAAWFNRDILLSQYPQLLLQARQICQQLDCTLIRNRNISAIKLLNRDVRVHPRYEEALLVNATITNLSKYTQRFPTVLLSLFDTNGNVIAYRQIPASDYLDSSIDMEAGMKSGTPIHFVFEVANSSSDAVSFEFDFL